MNEKRLKELEDFLDTNGFFDQGVPVDVADAWFELTSEVRRLRNALQIYADHTNWEAPEGGWYNDIFNPIQLELKYSDGYTLAKEALNSRFEQETDDKDPPSEP